MIMPLVNEKALFKFTQGLYVLGAWDVVNNRFAGSIVDAVMQIANKPLMVALSCNNNSYTRECIKKEGQFSISVLSKKVDPYVIANFGFQTSRNVNKWVQVEHYVSDDLPYLEGNLATVKATVKQEVDYESHTLFLAELCDCIDSKEGEPLTYTDYRNYFKDEVFKAFQEAKNKQEK